LETVTGGEARASEPIDARIFAGQQTQTMPDAAAFAEGYQNSLLSLLTFQ